MRCQCSYPAVLPNSKLDYWQPEILYWWCKHVINLKRDAGCSKCKYVGRSNNYLHCLWETYEENRETGYLFFHISSKLQILENCVHIPFILNCSKILSTFCGLPPFLVGLSSTLVYSMEKYIMAASCRQRAVTPIWVNGSTARGIVARYIREGIH